MKRKPLKPKPNKNQPNPDYVSCNPNKRCPVPDNLHDYHGNSIGLDGFSPLLRKKP